MAAKARKEAIAAVDRGDRAAADASFARIRAELANAPQTADVTTERANLEATQQMFEDGDVSALRKSMHYRQYHWKTGRGSSSQS